VSEGDELERLRKELGELRALVRELSARQVVAVSKLPFEAALALARSDEGASEAPFRPESWTETREMTPADIASEMALLWRRLPPREGA